MEPTTSDSGTRSFSIRILGVGDAGVTATAALVTEWSDVAGFAAVNTDDAAFSQCPMPERVLVGQDVARRLLGGNAELAAAAAETEAPRLRSLCAGMDLILMVAGLGGGAGSGICPVIARLARENSVPLLAFVSLPFAWEGSRRQQQARQSLQLLKQFADGVICLPNEKVARTLDPQTPLLEAFLITQRLLNQVVRAVGRLLLRPGHIHINFADLCAVLKGHPSDMFFLAAEASGADRAQSLLEKLEAQAHSANGNRLAETRAILISLVGPRDLSMAEVNLVMEIIRGLAPSASLMLGAGVDEQTDQLTVSLLAYEHAAAPTPQVSAGSHADPGSPLEFETQFHQANGNRPPSRFIPPPPELSPDAAEDLLARQNGTNGSHRKTGGRLRQGQLPLEVVSKGRFEKSEPTRRHGENLDVPTFIRRGISLD